MGHYVELRDHDVLKIFINRFDQQVERCETLHRLLDGTVLPSGWVARVPTLIDRNPQALSVTMTRAPGRTVAEALDAGQFVPWTAIGEALGHLHRRAREEGAPVHGDATIWNIMFCPAAREVWLIDPGVNATSNPWHDLLWLLWPIFRRRLGTPVAENLLRGWREDGGLSVEPTAIDEGWTTVRTTHLAAHPARWYLRHPILFVFRHLWVPLALWRLRRP